ncbi:MAG TPA: hypothetical protein EYH56_01650 [Nanoarchaeota archaeon]|nr:hypothetical protein [Nanoarchaeota archaeon]
MENQTIFAYFYKNVTGKCFSESPFDVKINDKILVLLSQRYFSQCIINLDENEFNRLITIPNLTFSEEGIIGKGCLRPVFNKYIIWNNGTFAVIRNKEEFKKFFAPIETPEEALSFAIAITGSYPKYDINISKNDFVILAPVIKGTYVKEVSNGFKVHLFDYQLCGCGYHPHYTVDYLVTKTGDIKEISRQVIYKLRYLMCVD